MNHRLLALDTADNIPLELGLIVVGRHPSCDFRIRSGKISRIHCCIHKDGNRLFVRDLNSTNGIRVNGRAVQHAELKPGDVLAIAQLHFKCVDSDDDALTEPKDSARGLHDKVEPNSASGNLADQPVPMPIAPHRHESSVDVRIRTGS